MGLGQPDCTTYEPAFAIDVEWTLSAALARLGRPDGRSAYPLRTGAEPTLTIAATGAMVPEALAAAEHLESLGAAVDVVVVTSPRLLFDAVRARAGHGGAAPLVTLLDGHPHTLAFLAGINHVRATHLGVTRFGQSGDLDAVYRYHGIDTDSVVAAALDLA